MADARRRYRFVVFDWDGTLVDSTAIIASAIQSACRDIGRPVPDEAAARYVIGLGLHDALRHVAPGLAGDGVRTLSERYRHHYLAREPEIPLFAGAIPMLTALRDAGCTLGIATGKTRKGLDRALEATGTARYFDATRCADEGRAKPHPDMLLHLMASVGLSASDTVMIGDTSHDVELARNAGVAAVAVATGAHEIDALLGCDATRVFGALEDARDWLLGEE